MFESMLEKIIRNVRRPLTTFAFAAALTFGCAGEDSRSLIDAGQHAYVECGEDGQVDILSDMDHCGSCTTTCDPGASCLEGVCTLYGRDAGQDCSPTTNIMFDDYNCGGCNIVCPPLTSCYEGACLFPGYVDAGNTCTTDADCPRADYRFSGPECITPRGSETSFCADPAKSPCELDSCQGENELCIVNYCTVVIYEQCDDFDNNRNGYVDEGVIGEACYTGPAETRNVGTCADGVRICVNGEWGACIGDSLPIPEIGILACDSLDNDCNGCPDNKYDPITGDCVPPEPEYFDITFIVDNSNSMASYINAAREAILRIGAPFAGQPTYRFALALIPYGIEGDLQSAVVQRFSEFGAFLTVFREVGLSAYGNEPTYDVMYHAVNGDLSELAYREDATRIYIMFTDEGAWSYEVPPVTKEQMCGAFRPEDVHAIVTTPSHVSEYDCFPIRGLLTDDPRRVSQDILDILGNACE